ncbi:alpha/beta hydrolase family protein [Mycolicibacterium sp. HK-90]|uniref:alpha/beta hydrolase n=1 Tax=Mycolicibacterium sp. HK-90 TaxID=3056937 RepID=UPI002659F69C|nr:alpha/beta hydrolase-fold protein [Mycolicibacterium sp. HK-90]WKG04779.1 alpha/beta hydrolase-fold protein [Mycolicibacterium sp. HK-90]
MSLISGLVPIILEVLAIAAVVLAIGRPSRSVLLRWVTIALLAGVLFAVIVRVTVKYQGWSERAASVSTVIWVVITGFAAAIMILAWRGSPWWRRTMSVLAVVLAVLCSFAELNIATGYFPTTQSLWQRVTGTDPPQWIEEDALAAMRQSGEEPTRGTMVWVDIPRDASGFGHRRELVYLPPAWFRSDPPPQLPAVMAIGAEFSHPSDWPESGGALKTLDEFAAFHHGYSPVVVFPDATGAFNNDTECVNGPRGNAADHLTKDVRPYVVSRFGVSSDPANWGLAGWSSGGTCSLMLAVRNPELFSAFVALDGQLGPNSGTKQQTISRLFGGDATAWASFDPKTLIEKHGPYGNMSAWLGVSEQTPAVHHAAGGTLDPNAIAGWDQYSEDHAANANKLCALLSANNVECSVVGYPGSHTFTAAGDGFKAALPWLAGTLGTPNADRVPLPGAPNS